MSCTSHLNPADLLPPSARRVPRPGRGNGWNTLADIEVFIFAVEAELEAMARERTRVHRRFALVHSLSRLCTAHLPAGRALGCGADWAAAGSRLAPGPRRRGPALGDGDRQPLAPLGPERLDPGHRWRHAGRALPAERDQVGSGAAVRLNEPLPAPQYHVRARA
jgi:hypothetical protein